MSRYKRVKSTHRSFQRLNVRERRQENAKVVLEMVVKTTKIQLHRAHTDAPRFY